MCIYRMESGLELLFLVVHQLVKFVNIFFYILEKTYDNDDIGTFKMGFVDVTFVDIR